MGAAYGVNGLKVVLQTRGTAILAGTVVVEGVLYNSQSVSLHVHAKWDFDEDNGPTRSQLLAIGLSEHNSSQVSD